MIKILMVLISSSLLAAECDDKKQVDIKVFEKNELVLVKRSVEDQKISQWFQFDGKPAKKMAGDETQGKALTEAETCPVVIQKKDRQATLSYSAPEFQIETSFLDLVAPKNVGAPTGTEWHIRKCFLLPNNNHVVVVNFSRKDGECRVISGGGEEVVFVVASERQSYVLNSVGFREYRSKQYASAKTHLEQALILNPEMKVARLNLVRVLALSKVPFSEARIHVDILLQGKERAVYQERLQSDKDFEFWKTDATFREVASVQ